MAALRSDWQTLLSVRDEALKVLEAARAEKRIGSSLEAQIHLAAPESIYPVLERYRDQLRYLFIVSDVVLERVPSQQRRHRSDDHRRQGAGTEMRTLLELFHPRGRRQELSHGVRALQRGVGGNRSDGRNSLSC